MNLIWKTTDISETKFRVLNICISLVPLGFALFFPLVGKILGYSASVSGFLMIYVIPVLAYLKMKKVEIMNPLLAAALQENEVDIFVPQRSTLPKNIEFEGDTGSKPLLHNASPSQSKNMSASPKLVISDRFLRRQSMAIGYHEEENKQEQKPAINIVASKESSMAKNNSISVNSGSNTEWD